MGLSPASLQRRQMNSPKDKMIDTVNHGVSISGKSLLVPNNAVIKRLWGKNIGVAPLYIQIFDSSALPAPAANDFIMTPLTVGAGLEFNMDFSEVPIICEHGIAICASSLALNFVAIAGDDLVCTMQYSDRV